MKSVTRTAALVTGAVAMLVAPLAAMKAMRDPGDPRLTVGAAPPATLIPGDVRDATGRMIAGAVWTGLVSYDPRSGAPVMASAESVTSPDRRVWTVRLRPGGRFHDGSPVTARSFTDAWAAVLREGWHGASMFTHVARVKGAAARADAAASGAGVEGLKVTDDRTFQVTLERPLNGFPSLLGDPAFLPMPESVLKSRDWTSYGRRPIGNGPLRVSAHGPRETVLERATGPERPNGTIVVKAMPDTAKQYSAVELEDLDVATAVPPGRHATMDGEFRDRHLTVAGRTMTHLAFPSWDKRFTPAVRQALSMAIDRNAVTAGPLGHQATPANSLVPPGVRFGRREGQCRLCLHDARAATAALDDAGGFEGTLTLWHAPADATWVEAIADQLRKGLTLDVQPRPVSPAELQAALDERRVDGPFVVHTTTAYPAPVAALRPLLEARTGYEDRYVSDLLTQAESAPTPENGVTPARLAESALLRDMAAMPLWSGHDHLVWSERLSGVSSAPFTGLRLDRLSLKG